MNQPMHRSLVVIDVEDSSTLSNPDLEAMRANLSRILSQATVGVETLVQQEDRGDGCMLVLELPVLEVLDRVVGGFLDGLRAHNNTVDPQDWIRVRIAVHEGYVHQDPSGWTSDALNATFRMNDAAVVKAALKLAARACGVIVVSDLVFRSVVRHNYRDTVTSAGYLSTVIRTKEDDHVRIWIRVPGYAQPQLPEEAVGSDPSAGAPVSGKLTVAPLPTGTLQAENVIVGDVRARTFIGRDNYGGVA